MIGRTHAAYVEGTRAEILTVEAEPTTDVGVDIVGLRETSARETRIRTKTALITSQLARPYAARVTVSPVRVRSSASYLDLAIAVALHAALTPELDRRICEVLLVGELGLNGDLRPSRGLLPQLLAARTSGLRTAVVPHVQLAEASLVDGVDAYGAKTLAQVVAFLRGERDLPPAREVKPGPWRLDRLPPVVGFEELMRPLQVAARGRHPVLFVGPFGSGKVMLARRLPGMMTEPSVADRLEIATHRSAAGLSISEPIQRPFRAPHHTASRAALLGGGDPVRPGEVSLAHHGVLLLDELAEFERGAVDEVLRAVERGHVSIRRRKACVSMDCDTLVAGATAACPCGRRGAPRSDCQCSAERIERYFARVPLHLFDMHIVLGTAGPPASGRRDEERLHRVAQTIARLEGRAVTAADIAEAQRYAPA